jgi:hypothetical protein
MQKKSIMSRSFWLIVVAGMTTGMGNGSVFGAAVMCLVGRGPFANWGGEGASAYNPTTFNGFIDFAMLVFGVLFCIILAIGLSKHDALENA